MKIRSNHYALPIEPMFVDILNSHLDNFDINPDGGCSIVVLNFRDSTYSAEAGGYHPVEIAIGKESAIMYVTEFSYVGCGVMAELAKEIDFDFTAGIFQHFGRVYAIESGLELFELWQQNFCHYYKNRIYEVTVTPC